LEQEYLVRRHSILQTHRAQERIRTRFCSCTHPSSDHLSFGEIAHSLSSR
jgi:hypothetical protein